VESARSQCNGQAYRVGRPSKVDVDRFQVSYTTCLTERPLTVKRVGVALKEARPVLHESPVCSSKIPSSVGCRCCRRPHWIARRHYGDHGDGYAGEEEPKAGLSDVRRNGVAVVSSLCTASVVLIITGLHMSRAVVAANNGPVNPASQSGEVDEWRSTLVRCRWRDLHARLSPKIWLHPGPASLFRHQLHASTYETAQPRPFPVFGFCQRLYRNG
jgi:hypothetical protein